MRSATSSESPRLVRIAVPCAQTRVATEPRAKQETRSVLYGSLIYSGGRFDIRAD